MSTLFAIATLLTSCQIVDYFTLPRTKVDLGEKLFHDPILSSNKKVSCASCHLPEYAFSDTSMLSKGVENRLGKRNTPSVMNMKGKKHFFYDGRAKTLEHQATFPIEDHNEMALFIDSAISNVVSDKYYVKAFEKLYRELPTEKNILDAIALFEKIIRNK